MAAKLISSLVIIIALATGSFGQTSTSTASASESTATSVASTTSIVATSSTAETSILSSTSTYVTPTSSSTSTYVAPSSSSTYTTPSSSTVYSSTSSFSTSSSSIYSYSSTSTYVAPSTSSQHSSTTTYTTSSSTYYDTSSSSVYYPATSSSSTYYQTSSSSVYNPTISSSSTYYQTSSSSVYNPTTSSSSTYYHTSSSSVYYPTTSSSSTYYHTSSSSVYYPTTSSSSTYYHTSSTTSSSSISYQTSSSSVYYPTTSSSSTYYHTSSSSVYYPTTSSSTYYHTSSSSVYNPTISSSSTYYQTSSSSVYNPTTSSSSISYQTSSSSVYYPTTSSSSTYYHTSSSSVYNTTTSLSSTYYQTSSSSTYYHTSSSSVYNPTTSSSSIYYHTSSSSVYYPTTSSSSTYYHTSSSSVYNPTTSSSSTYYQTSSSTSLSSTYYQTSSSSVYNPTTSSSSTYYHTSSSSVYNPTISSSSTYYHTSSSSVYYPTTSSSSTYYHTSSSSVYNPTTSSSSTYYQTSSSSVYHPTTSSSSTYYHTSSSSVYNPTTSPSSTYYHTSSVYHPTTSSSSTYYQTSSSSVYHPTTSSSSTYYHTSSSSVYNPTISSSSTYYHTSSSSVYHPTTSSSSTYYHTSSSSVYHPTTSSSSTYYHTSSSSVYHPTTSSSTYSTGSSSSHTMLSSSSIIHHTSTAVSSMGHPSTSMFTAPSSSSHSAPTSSSSGPASSSTYVQPSSSMVHSSTSTYVAPSSSSHSTPSSSTHVQLSSSSHSTPSSSTHVLPSSSSHSAPSSSTHIQPSSSMVHSSTSTYVAPSSSSHSTPSSSTHVRPSSSSHSTPSSSTHVPPSSSSHSAPSSSTHIQPSSSLVHSSTSTYVAPSSSSHFTSSSSTTLFSSISPTTQTQSTPKITATPTNSSSTSATIPNVVTTPPPSRLYPHGSSQGDVCFGNRFLIRRRLRLKSPIYFANRFYQTLYICSNGYVTFRYSHCYYYPSQFRYYNIPLVASFFSGNDMREYYNIKSRICYQEYTTFTSSSSSQSIFTRATTDVNQFQSYLNSHLQANWTTAQLTAKFGLFHQTVNNFVAKHVIVITWSDMVPYPSRYYSRFGFTNTFQLVLVSNGENTFALHNYEVNGMQWWRRFSGLRARVGYATGTSNVYHEIAKSGHRDILKIDSFVGNTGITGKWAFRLDPNTFHVNYVQKCLAWWYNQYHISYYNQFMNSPCPCTWRQVWFDRRFNWWGSVARYPCAQSRFSSPTLNGDRMHRVCCYTTNSRRFGALIHGSPDGGTLTYANRQLRNTDNEAYQNCCIRSRLCYLYYNKRSSGSCRGYRPPRRTWFWGDPHIRTLDGKQYTFNGLGEYNLINLQNDYVMIQARTSQALVNGTRSAKATVFSAVAAKQNNSDVIQATLNDQNDGLDILVNGNLSLTMNDLSQNQTREFNNVDLALSQNGSLVVAFSSGTSLEVTVLPGLISIAVNAPSSLQGNSVGLLGTWNGDMNDDFTRPDGTKIPINATEIEVYYGFGEKWKINETQSLFTYPPGTTYYNFTDPNFTPEFSDNITALFGGDTALYQQALNSCGNNIPCLYDASQTLDVELAVQGKDTADGYEEAENEAENFPPVINGPSIMNVTYGEVFTASLSISDPNTGDSVTVSADNIPTGASIDPTSYQFTWNVSSYTNISIQIVARDSKGATSIYSPTQILMCYCANGGVCDYTGETVEDSSVSQVPCVCSDGWSGDHCTLDFDSCANFPCFENVTCTDNQAPLTGYTCGSCPQGYTGDGRFCSDFDECSSSATNNCQQVCVNAVGSYTCSCNSGYELNSDGKTCSDIDECFKNPQICSQICTNTNGSYICSCNSGFNLNSDNKTCTATTSCSANNNCSDSCTRINGKDQCACRNGYVLQSDGTSCVDRNECADQTAMCQMLCNNTAGGYDCGCSSGYTMNADGRTCTDINECSTSNPCDANANCQNTPGSYVCSCKSGYNGNGKTCSDINECSANNPCGNNANCFNSAGSYNCQCKPGFYAAGNNLQNGNSCQKERAYQLAVRVDATFNPLFNDKTSTAYKNEVAKLQEAILSAYQNNSQTVNEVKTVTITNLRQGSVIADCVVTVLKNYTRGTTVLKNIIQTGTVSSYVVQSANVTDYNECANPADNSCVGNQQCINTIGSYTCNCSTGYLFNSTQQQCVDINECKTSTSTCHVNANCMNTAGSYQCQCKSGYIGNGKSNCTLVCTANYCSGNGICYVTNNIPRCNCTTPGTSGSRCVLTAAPFSTGAIVGISLGAIIGILFFIAVIFICYRHNKSKQRRAVTPDEGLLTSRKSPQAAFEDNEGNEVEYEA